MAPPSFASAAAGNNNQASARDSSDWSRRNNGATQTFRRTSVANNTPSAAQSQEPAGASFRSGPYVPPQHRNGVIAENRYDKTQMLDLFKMQQTSNGGLDNLPSDLFMGGFHPRQANGTSGGGWSRSEHQRDNNVGPGVCWDNGTTVEPLGLFDMDQEERELFSTSVNTPVKPPTANKDNTQGTARKISVSQGVNSPGGFGMPSPTASRAPGRRREASESYPFPSANTVASPTAGFNREEQRAASPPPALQRRRTDMKDAGRAEDAQKDAGDKSATTPFGTLKRQGTGPLGGFAAPSSPWTAGTPSGGFSPMGSAFGNFNIGGQPSTPGDKRAGAASGRQESRFKGLLNKDSNEDMGGPRSLKEKGSVSSLGKLNENDPWRQPERQDLSQAPLEEAEEEMGPSGSAALAAESDLSPSKQRQAQDAFGTPSRAGNPDDFGFGAFGMHPENNPGFGQGFGGNAYQQTPSQSRGGLQSGGNDPMSPTDTNPYRSPEQQGLDQLRGEMDSESNSRLPGLGGFGGDAGQQNPSLSGLGGLPPFARGGDRSQTSSTGPNRGFPSMGGFGGFGQGGSSMWPLSQGGLGTPGRQTAGLSNAFGGGIFSSMGEVQSPSLAGLGGNNVMSPGGGNAFGGSRMASMFPPAMQDQMRQDDQEQGGPPPHFPGLGRDVPREGESPFQSQGFNDLLRGAQRDSTSADPQASQSGAPGQQAPIGRQLGQVGQAQQPGSSASAQPPAPQQRTMVMPDRMRWIYRDPQGQTQGPWSGLEMHDWYKAGFFSPELLVKKYEDPEYEPLAQLIRRIGNSREPFLVPQIGIPHGPAPPASSQGPSAWPSSTGPLSAGSASSGGGGAQPPFASSFPSFGTTLTADQQNALERRKQEEQYLMARQKEHLAQAQIAQRLQMGSAPGGSGLAPSGSGQLHHQGSAQSLHSQPSFGSMASPSAAAYQPSPSQGPAGGSGQAQGFFDNSFRAAPGGGLGAVGAGVDSLGHITEEDIPGIMDRLNLGGQQNQFGAPGQGIGQQQQQQQQTQEREQQIRQMLQDRARLQQEQAQYDAQQSNEQMPNERLEQFQQLRAETDDAESRFPTTQTESAQRSEQQQQEQAQEQQRPAQAVSHGQQQGQEPLSLTEQVQKAASAKQSPAPAQSAWGKVNTDLPQPFPPAPSQSPLPAPAAQRTSRQSVADHLHHESRSRSQTPSVDTPSAAVAPWAKEPTEAPKGPSLKEIQEAEAKVAAQNEELAAAARRSAAQREMEAQAQAQQSAPAPGLPASSKWATGAAGSPGTPTGAGASPWGAKVVHKAATPANTKSMAQIQKEEEARKNKLAAAAAAAAAAKAPSQTQNVPPPSAGKSYANLAGKVSMPPPNAAGTGAWTTVGASGKTKTPAPAPAPTPVQRAPSAANLQPAAQPKKVPSRSSTMTSAGGVNAQEEFRKWAVNELRPDLTKGISADDFVAQLVFLPPDTDIITEAVHHSSNTIDSRHFAEEFIRRKKLADKGLVDTSAPTKTSSPANAGDAKGGGWSEVAKKGPVRESSSKEESSSPGNGAFRVVPAKKKGGKR
ncbi:hypothetical protein MBLNU230_g5192t1 [Neophaeotheca triangularis]